MSFDQLIDRRAHFAFKWEKYKGKDILPLWVADMDFRCAQPILDALNKTLDHGILGYVLPSQYTPAIEAVQHWLSTRHSWQIEADWLQWTPGVVPAFNMACKAVCEPGDKVIVQTPNYPPLLAAPELNGLERVALGSVLSGETPEEQRWTLDFDVLEQAAADPKAKLLILCNPMNPQGTVLTQAEMDRIADIVNQHDLILCSDEIHCDLILDPELSHLPASKHERLAERSITLMAASKTFNIAGLGTSFAIVPNAQLRRRFVSAGAGITPWANLMGLVATEAAFTLADDWYENLLSYLRGNRDYLVEAINAIEGLQLHKPEATYLAWIRAHGLGVESPQRYFEGKGLGPSPGADFGDKSCVRINYGCPRSYLEQAIQRLTA